jgi:hypothetical protein
MFRALLAFVRPLHTLAKAAVRIADALDRIAPKQRTEVEPDYIGFEEADQDAEAARRAAYERDLGRPLDEDEEIPSDYNPRDARSYIKHFLLGKAPSA